MTILNQAQCLNRLLAYMREEDFALLAPHLELRDSPTGYCMSEADVPIEHSFFPETCTAFIVSASRGGDKVQAGLVGSCGFGPVATILGTDRSPQQIVVQIPGKYYRISRTVLVTAAEESASLRNLLLRFVHVLSIQFAHTSLSNAIHQVDERLARWILMCHDRSASGELALTHDFISRMLAVRRPSVTTSLHVLEGNHLIRNERRHIYVRDRKALEDFASDSYGAPEAEYERLIGPLTPPSILPFSHLSTGRQVRS